MNKVVGKRKRNKEAKYHHFLMLVNEIETAQFMEIVICFMIRFLLPITGREKRGENLLTENNGTDRQK